MEGVSSQIHHKSKTNKQRPNKQSVQEIQNLQSGVFSHETNSQNENAKRGRFSLHVGPEYKQWTISKFDASLSFDTIFQIYATNTCKSPLKIKFLCLQSNTSSIFCS